MDAGIINYAVYENGSEYLGMANVTLPNQSHKILTVNGAGIPGDIDLPVLGHKDAMRATFNFTDAPPAAYKLAEMRRHVIDIRAAHEEYDATAGKIVVRAYKHVLEIIPVTKNGGTVAPSAAQAASGEYTVLSQKDYIDGKLVGDYDPVHFKDIDNSGTDNLAAVRSALGK
ncbi:MAG: phage major tail tube protein [Clostridia bacterium]|nr:phage major tail tube protein [Clostridia bacterium]